MTEQEIKNFVDSPPVGFEKLAFGYRQSIAARRQLEQKIKQLQADLGQAQQDYLRAIGVEKGYFESIGAIEPMLSAPKKEAE